MRLDCRPLIYTSVREGVSGYQLAYCEPQIRADPAIAGWLTDKIEEIKAAGFGIGARIYVTQGTWGFFLENRHLQQDWAGRSGTYVTGWSFDLQTLAESRTSILGASQPFEFLTHEQFADRDPKKRQSELDNMSWSVRIAPLSAGPIEAAEKCAMLAVLRLLEGRQVVAMEMSWEEMNAVACLAAPAIRPHLTFCLGGDASILLGCGLQQLARRPGTLPDHAIWWSGAQPVDVEATSLAAEILKQLQGDPTAEAYAVMADGSEVAEGWRRRAAAHRHRQPVADFADLASRTSREFLQTLGELSEALPDRFVQLLAALSDDTKLSGAAYASCMKGVLGHSQKLAEHILNHGVTAIVNRLRAGASLVSLLRESDDNYWQRTIFEATRHFPEATSDPAFSEEFMRIRQPLAEEWLFELLKTDATLAADVRWRRPIETFASSRIWSAIKPAAFKEALGEWVWSNPQFLETLSPEEIVGRALRPITDELVARYLADRRGFGPDDLTLVTVVIQDPRLKLSRQTVWERVAKQSDPEVQNSVFTLMLDYPAHLEWPVFLALIPDCAAAVPHQEVLRAAWMHAWVTNGITSEFLHGLRDIQAQAPTPEMKRSIREMYRSTSRLLSIAASRRRHRSSTWWEMIRGLFSSCYRDELSQRTTDLRSRISNMTQEHGRSDDLADRLYEVTEQFDRPSVRLAVAYLTQGVLSGDVEVKEATRTLRKFMEHRALRRGDRKCATQLVTLLEHLQTVAYLP